MPSEEVCNASPATVTLEPWQRDSGHLAVSAPAWFSDTAPGFYRIRTETRLWANHESRGGCVPALKLRRKREGSRKKCQGFKPDLGDPAVRDYRGASGNVAMVEMRSHLATERAGLVTLHLQADAPGFYPNRMKESYREGVANHPGPEPCEGSRKAALEALDRGICRLGIELRNRVVQGADGVRQQGRQQRDARQRECGAALRSRRPQACRETPCARTGRPRCRPPAVWRAGGRRR
jgi:hypothetical protein